MEEFRIFDKASFPLTFSYPITAKYVEVTKRKYGSTVCLRERKEKYERMTPEEIEKLRHQNIGGGSSIKWVFPKLLIAYFKAYVPAYQTSNKRAYFMSMDEYLKKAVMWDIRKNSSNAISNNITLDFGKGEMLTHKHESDHFFRSEVYISDKDDDEKFLHILYKHNGAHHSFDEINAIMNSIIKRK